MVRLVVLLLLGGCLPSVGDFELGGPAPGGGDASSPGRDSGMQGIDATTDAAPGDSTTPSDANGQPGEDRCSPTPTCAGGCAKPWLLAAVEELPPGNGCNGGRIWRWSLAGDLEGLCVCEPLDGAESLGPLPFALGFVPPETVVSVEQTGQVLAINGFDDSPLWSASIDVGTTGLPVDVIAIEDDTARLRAGVAIRSLSTSSVQRLHTYDAATGGSEQVLMTSDLSMGSGIRSMTQSPFSPRSLRALRTSGEHFAVDIDPWANTASTHTRNRMGFVPDTIHAMYDGVFHRTTFTARQTERSDNRSGVYRIAQGDDQSDHSFPLGDHCTQTPDRVSYDATCEFVHAVADPNSNLGSFAICQHAPGERRIVHVAVSTCTDLIETTEVFSSARVTQLALGVDSHWVP